MSERTPKVGERVFDYSVKDVFRPILSVDEDDPTLVRTEEYLYLGSLVPHTHIEDLWMVSPLYEVHDNPMRERMLNKLMELFYNVSTPVASGGIKTARFNKNSDYVSMSDEEFLEAYNNVLRCAYKSWG